MKNKLTLLAVLLLGTIFTNAQTDYGDGSKRLRAARSNSWNTTTLAWAPSDSSLFQYNTRNQQTQASFLAYNAGTSAWDGKRISYNLYDANGNNVLRVDSQFNPAQYQLRIKRSQTYNANNLITSETNSFWDGANSKWFLGNRYQYSYTSANKINVALLESYDTAAGAWKNYDRNISSYNANGQLDTLFYELWIGNSWKSNYRYMYTYDGNGNQVYVLIQKYNNGTSSWDNYATTETTFDAGDRELVLINSSWNAATSSWTPNSRYTSTYNAAGRKTSYLIEQWNTSASAWQNENRYTYVYNANNWQTEYLRETWSTNTLNWQNGSHSAYTYDGNGYRIFGLDEVWNINTLQWENSYQGFFYYEPAVPTGISSLENSIALSVYPNPIYGNDFFVKTEVETKYRIFDLAGRMLQEGMLEVGQNQIELSNTSAGIYLLRAGNSTTKLVKNSN